jgi:hypothetical protein
LIAIGRPFERLIAAWKHWQAEKARVITSPTVGIIERIDHPNIVRVRLSRHSSWKPGMLHTAAMSNGDQHYVMALFAQVQGLDVMGTGLCVAELQDRIVLAEGDVIQSHSPRRQRSS